MQHPEVLTAELVPMGAPSTELERHIPDPSQWIESWLGSLKPNSARAYRKDLALFASHNGYGDVGVMAGDLLTRRDDSHFVASAAVDAWKTSMLTDGLAPATVNRRLSALRSMVKHAHRSGLISWTVTIQGVRTTAYRDTSGPGVAVVRDMVASLDADTAKATRDRAILRLLFDMGLRRGEIVALDVADIDLDRCRANVVGKGKREAEPLTIPAKTCDSIDAWLKHRGDHVGPLFTSLDRVSGGGRLTGRSVGRIVSAAGVAVGVEDVRPHGLRHTAITHVLDRTNGNVRDARKFSRHSKLDTLAIYDDNRDDVAGELASLIAADV